MWQFLSGLFLGSWLNSGCKQEAKTNIQLSSLGSDENVYSCIDSLHNQIRETIESETKTLYTYYYDSLTGETFREIMPDPCDRKVYMKRLEYNGEWPKLKEDFELNLNFVVVDETYFWRNVKKEEKTRLSFAGQRRIDELTRLISTARKSLRNE